MRAFVFPGQGSQRKGMGKDLFDRFPAECEIADRVLGYSIRELCLDDPEGRLKLTQFVQPALFVTNALTWMQRTRDGSVPDFYAGHSLGEYNALLAAGCMDFEVGIRLIKRRGELMGMANGGRMAAIIGLSLDRVAAVLAEAGIDDVDVANHNARVQVVLSGPPEGLERATAAMAKERGVRAVPLKMSAASHSRYMEPAASAFAEYLEQFRFENPRTPVLANVTAAPIQSAAEIPSLLKRQISGRVRWWETMKHLRAAGVNDLEELGPGHVLSDLWATTSSESPQAAEADRPRPPPRSFIGVRSAGADMMPESTERASAPRAAPRPLESAPVPLERQTQARSTLRLSVSPELLGSAEFRRDHGVSLAYVAGAMFRGIASTDLVIRMAKAGLLSFYGAGGMTMQDIESAILRIKAAVPRNAPWGMNLLHAYGDPALELSTVELYHRHEVRTVEAAAFVQMTAPLVLFRFRGAHRGAAGRPIALQRVIAKVSRPETAQAFMSPAPEGLVRALVDEGRLSAHEGTIALELPISDDICVEADSGGHTDARQLNSLLPAIARLRDEIAKQHRYASRIRIGAAGGIGSPEAVASAFVLGADFVLGGSVHQCSPESGTSAAVKEMLAGLGVQDTAYAPAGDAFEAGSRVQVVRKGTLFPGRGNKLHELYRHHASLDELDARTRDSLEQFYFGRSLDEVWRSTCDYFTRSARSTEIELAERDPRRKMALVFRAYFAQTIQWALRGDVRDRANFQIHCGPAMGAFNAVVRHTKLEAWQNRHVDLVAAELMIPAAARVDELMRKWGAAAMAAPAVAFRGGEDGIRTHL